MAKETTHSLGDFLNAINVHKENIIREDGDQAEKAYTPFVINKGMSFYPDTIMYANEMNMHSTLPKVMQLDYYIHGVRKRKRFSTWYKTKKDEVVELIKEYYSYNDERAREVLSILTDDDIEKIKIKMFKGGMNNGTKRKRSKPK